jgi:Esterase/lipase
MCLIDCLIKTWWKKVKKADDERLAKKQPITGVSEQLDVPYLNDGEPEHLLDIYRPEGVEEKLPVIVDIHGGGWAYGSKELNKYYCLSLAKRGFAVVNINYHLIPKYDVIVAVKDIFAALSFVSENGEKLRLDTKNVFLTGDSAGGHYTSLVTSIIVDDKLQELFGVKATIKPNAIGLTCGVYDLLPVTKIAKGMGVLYIKRMFGKKRGFMKTDIFRAACVVNNNIKAFPPTFINSTYADFLKEQNISFHKLLVENGVECEFDFYDKPESNNKLEHVFNVCYPEWAESKKTNNKQCAFFRAHLK